MIGGGATETSDDEGDEGGGVDAGAVVTGVDELLGEFGEVVDGESDMGGVLDIGEVEGSGGLVSNEVLGLDGHAVVSVGSVVGVG
jgi:hypothetical protein